ncbi:hypothetical protein [Paraburkholderia sp. UYCP14C]|uniref:hypothetical protein n=1 Tax=Paraburkholderia sp. UYCP14C TaxID=2511130 RepID=UPI00145A0135|nr:hypothetical protein [Paraburkholderia sp. UYCP14C]
MAEYGALIFGAALLIVGALYYWKKRTKGTPLSVLETLPTVGLNRPLLAKAEQAGAATHVAPSPPKAI